VLPAALAKRRDIFGAAGAQTHPTPPMKEFPEEEEEEERGGEEEEEEEG
jgi:hypothetical protein